MMILLSVLKCDWFCEDRIYDVLVDLFQMSCFDSLFQTSMRIANVFDKVTGLLH